MLKVIEEDVEVVSSVLTVKELTVSAQKQIQVILALLAGSKMMKTKRGKDLK